MMQEEFKDLIFKFVRHASVDEVSYIFLFGSIAKGDADKRSDADFLVVLDTENRDYENLEARIKISELALTLEKEFDRNIQIIFTNRNYEGLDNHFIEEVLKEGMLLYAKAPSIIVNSLELEPYALIIYDLRNIDSKEKMKINRLLYGHKTKKSVKRKIYESEKMGFVQKFQGLHVGSGVIAIPQKNAINLEEEMSKLKIKFKKTDLWLTRDSLKKLQQ